MLRSLVAATAFLVLLIAPPSAAEPLRSECLAMANAAPRAIPVSLRRVAANPEEGAITHVGHSTFYIDTPGGGRIATDFTRAYRADRLPAVVTRSRAHCTHCTL